jgi:hypothetical protein
MNCSKVGVKDESCLLRLGSSGRPTQISQRGLVSVARVSRDKSLSAMRLPGVIYCFL